MKHYPLPRKNLASSAIIVANGQFPTHPVPLSLLETGVPVVCCDGALRKLLKAKVMPTVVIGDCDSLSEQDRQQYASMICRIAEQESNDLTKAVRYCVEQGWKDLVILGATGGREDHTIANISLLADYLDITREVWMVSDYGVMNAISEEATFESFPGQQVSIFSIEPAPMSSEPEIRLYRCRLHQLVASYIKRIVKRYFYVACIGQNDCLPYIQRDCLSHLPLLKKWNIIPETYSLKFVSAIFWKVVLLKSKPIAIPGALIQKSEFLTSANICLNTTASLIARDPLLRLK